jgi:hypothetical protein
MSKIFPVFEGDGATNLPRYPTVNDFGGIAFENDQRYPPREGKRLRAENYMQLAMAVDRVCRMTATLVIEFSPGYTGYTPNLPAIVSVTSVIDSIDLASVSIARASQGVYRIYYPQNKMPPKRQMAQIWNARSVSISNSFANQAVGYTDVTLYNQSGTLTDDPAFKYTLRLFGE